MNTNQTHICRSIRALWLSAACLIGANAAGQDVIFVPATFPAACAESLSNGRPYCPPGIAQRAQSFCEGSTAGLHEWVKQNGMPVCGQQGGVSYGGQTYDQVLLVDDRQMSPALRQLLNPLSFDGRVSAQGGLYRNMEFISRRVLVVFESGNVSSNDGTPVVTGTATPASSTDSNQSASGGSSQPDNQQQPDSGSAGASGGTQTQSSDQTAQNVGSGTDGGQANTASETPNSADSPTDETRRPTNSDPWHPVTQTIELQIPFSRNFIDFRNAYGRALSRHMMRERAYEFARELGIQGIHRQLLRGNCDKCAGKAKFANGDLINITVRLERRNTTRRVEGVGISTWRAEPD